MKPPPTLLLVIATVVGALLLIKGCDDRQAPPTGTRQGAMPRERTPLIQQLKVEGRREIAPGQTITVLRIPDPLLPDSDLMDRYCFIYEHHEYRTAQLHCGPD